MTFIKNSQFDGYDWTEDAWPRDNLSGTEPVTPSNELVFEWGQFCSDTESDLLIRSETGSTSLTDDQDTDVSLQLKEQLTQFENALYKDLPYDELHPSSLKESQQWSLHSPHLRILGKHIEPEVVDNFIIQEEEGKEETYIIHGESEENSSQNESAISSLERDPSRNSSSSSTCNTDIEKTKNEILERLFQKLWPLVVEQVEPTIKKLIAKNYNYYSTKPVKSPEELTLNINVSDSLPKRLSESQLVIEGKEHIQNSAIHVSSLPIRFKSSRSQIVGFGKQSIYYDDHRLDTNVLKSTKKKPKPLSHSVVTFPPKEVVLGSATNFSRDIPKERKSTILSAKLNKERERTVSKLYSDSRFCWDYSEPFSNCQSKSRHGLLPPIENLEISGKASNIRSNSAYLNYQQTNTQCLNSTRNKSGLLSPIRDGLHIIGQKKIGSNKQLTDNKNFKSSTPGVTDMKVKSKKKVNIPWK